MNRCCLSSVIVAALMTAAAGSVGATTFQGELIGIWTVGVPEVEIEPGESFGWSYIYESDDPAGNGPVYNPQVFRNDIKGITEMDYMPHFLHLVVDSGIISDAIVTYQFADPRFSIGTSAAFGLFRISGDSFGGFGEGTARFSNPAAVPESYSIAYALVSIGGLLAGRLRNRGPEAGIA